jgi:hypothetical protein
MIGHSVVLEVSRKLDAAPALVQQIRSFAAKP